MQPTGERSEPLAERTLRRILDVARALSASTDVPAILGVIIDAMRDLLDAERATVFEHDPETNVLFGTVAHGFPADSAAGVVRIPAERGIAGECFRRSVIVNIRDAYADERFDPEVDRRSGFRTRSILSIPLIAPEGIRIGVAQVLNKREGAFTAADESLANALAAQAAVAIRRGRLIEDGIVRRRLERELELARAIQQGTFPRTLPTLPGFGLAAWCAPAEETGGDAYDVITDGAGADGAHLLLADATGHGVGPALSVTELRAMVRMAIHVGADLDAIAEHANRQLAADLPGGRFITAWFARVHAGTGTIESLSAGQAPLLLYHAAADRFDELNADMIPLGLDPATAVPAPRRFDLEPGDLFAVLSDGIYEAFDPDGAPYGVERVRDLLRAHRAADPEAIAGAIRAAVDAHAAGAPAADDQTVLIVKRLRAPVTSGEGG